MDSNSQEELEHKTIDAVRRAVSQDVEERLSEFIRDQEIMRIKFEGWLKAVEYETKLASNLNSTAMCTMQRAEREVDKVEPSVNSRIKLLSIIFGVVGFILAVVGITQFDDVGNMIVENASGRIENIFSEQVKAQFSFGESVEHYYNKQYRRALESIGDAIGIVSDRATFWLLRGNIYSRMEIYEEALKSYDTALSIDKDDSSVWHEKGYVLRKLKKNQEALEALDQSVRLNPDNWASWYTRGYVLYDLGQHEDASKSFEICLNIERQEALCWNGISYSLNRMKEFSRALQAANRAIEIKGEWAPPWRHKGVALTGLSKYAEALSAHQEAIKLEGGIYPKAVVSMGDTYSRMGDRKRALESLSRAVDQDRSMVLFLMDRGWYKELRGDEDFERITQ